MQKILAGVILLMGIYVPIILASVGFDFFSVKFDNINSFIALIGLTFIAGAHIFVGIDEFLDEKFNCWH